MFGYFFRFEAKCIRVSESTYFDYNKEGSQITGFIEGQYSTFKKVYLQGILKATLSWYLTGEPGWVLRVNNVEFKTHFKNKEDAEKVADAYVLKKFRESEFFKDF